MLGTRLPKASVMALHTSPKEVSGHARLLSQFRMPESLQLDKVVAAGLWGDGIDIRRLANTPTTADVQVAIGTRVGQQLLEPETLRAVLSLSRWTLISLPLGTLHDGGDNPIRRALAIENDEDLHLDAEVEVLGLVRVPATQEMQALFIVWAWQVERKAHTDWHNASNERHVVTFGIERNTSMAGFEVQGLPVETLLALGLPQSERAQLVGSALRTVQPGPASFVLCCGGVMQWDKPKAEVLKANTQGVLTYIACMFGLAPRAASLIQTHCRMHCEACDQEPLTSDIYGMNGCAECADCLTQAVVPRLPASASGSVQPKSVAFAIEVTGFAGPFDDDVPGFGDLGNVLVGDLEECAHLCRENPRCLSFEFSPTMVASVQDKVRNCQLASSRSSNGQKYADFVLYIKNGAPASVDEKLAIIFGSSDDEAAEPEALQDGGRAFGDTTLPGVGRHGWICGDGVLFGSEPGTKGKPGGALKKSSIKSHNCPLGQVWQMEVPPGVYDVRATLLGPSVGTSCTAEGVNLQSVAAHSSGGATKDEMHPHPGGQLGPAAAEVVNALEEASAAAAAEARSTAEMARNMMASGMTTPPPTLEPTIEPPGAAILHASGVSVANGLLRLSGCSSKGQYLYRVVLRRTLRHCPVPTPPRSDAGSEGSGSTQDMGAS
eukprot:gnl/TRDRNA2_/TRDRNA2_170933_c4_seq2.p1 gnl/TRDRNA2_/TRDRNA2_170933_c4~~gnl/TRDRNA2_/TRDRNA2_170933_c4_seq2.p1  ORF type:complete len:679 (-),score=110.30 gnl/TRDRNA2_/TRDRNA2_170933_c4_seq2:80-2068(-)